MNLRYTPAARDDLRRIRDYLRDELAQPLSAERIPAEIVRRCARLKTPPRLGPPLAPRVRRPADLRYLPCAAHLAFYRIDPDAVSILRILNTRQDFVRILGLTPTAP